MKLISKGVFVAGQHKGTYVPEVDSNEIYNPSFSNFKWQGVKIPVRVA